MMQPHGLKKQRLDMATKDLNKQMMKPMSQWTMWLEMNDKQFKIVLVGVSKN